MSVRAHLVKKIEYEEGTLFNLWHDEMLMDLIGEYIYPQIASEGTGMCSLYFVDIEEVLELLKVKKGNKKETEYTIKVLKDLKKRAKKEGYITIDCF